MDQTFLALGRREARKRDRRDAILAVAATSFMECGYAGTTMSGIAATLGGSKGTLWSYFPSKEALFDAVLDHATVAFRAHLREILHPCGDTAATLDRFCISLLNKIVQPNAIALHRLVLAEAGRFPKVGRIFHDRARGMTQIHLADFLAGAMARGQLRQDDPSDAAQGLLGLILGGCHHLLLAGLIEQASAADIEADVHRALTIFLRAYAPST